MHLVVVWANDRVRIMAWGGPELFERFETQPWPEEVYADGHGVFFYHVVEDPLSVNRLLTD